MGQDLVVVHDFGLVVVMVGHGLVRLGLLGLGLVGTAVELELQDVPA